MLGPEGEDDGVVVRRRLQLEVERDAEALAQREAERAVDGPPNGAWMMSCDPSLSSKQRSTTMRSVVGKWPSATSPAAQ